MRRLIVLFLSFCAICSANAAQRDTLRVLAIGNSFSEDAVETQLYGLFEAEGIPVIIGNLYIGGCSLERHYNNTLTAAKDYRYRKIVNGITTTTYNVDINTGLCDEPWDYISLQQASPLSGKIGSFVPYLGQLIEYISENVDSDYKLLWHMTWAYQGNSDHPSFPDYDCDQKKMYDAIVRTSKSVMEDYVFDAIIPCGTTIQNARVSHIGDYLTRDGYHLDFVYGRYAAACTWFEVITGKNVVGNKYTPRGLSRKYAKTCQRAAHNAVINPYINAKPIALRD